MSAVHLIGAALTAAPQYGTSGLRKWLDDNVVTVLILVIGIVLLIAAQKAHASKVIMVGGLSLIGLFWLGLAASGNVNAVSQWLVNLTSS